MKRGRVAAKANVTDVEGDFKGCNTILETKEEDMTQTKVVKHKNAGNKKSKGSSKIEHIQNGLITSAQNYFETLPEDLNKTQEVSNSKINLKRLGNRNKDIKEEYKTKINKVRAIVDLEMMKDELKQLEDPPETPLEKEICSARLPYSFFDVPCEELAQRLLGKILVRRLENGTLLKGRIVETEGYLGVEDKASHTYQKKVTARNIPMYMPPGTIYVYMTYGMYHCFNISSQGEGCAVLIRAVDPLEGTEHMATQRNAKNKSKLPTNVVKEFKVHELCNGPSKLCMAYQLHKSHSKYSMCTWKGLWVENDFMEADIKIVKCARIGIDSYGPEWANKPLRYYIYENKSVSKRNKKAEALLEIH
ncbi:hypothetical protein KM043_011387 [Ampulex compressa]|nr:hypothetical protein KM043_011387 [Ampulex compressa]